jgi:hypothetical protein
MTDTQPRPDTETRHSLRTEVLEARPVNLDGFVEAWPEKGLVAMESDFDPVPSVRVEDGRIVELDGKEADALAARLPHPVPGWLNDADAEPQHDAAATAAGSGASGGSFDRSSSQA